LRRTAACVDEKTIIEPGIVLPLVHLPSQPDSLGD